MSNPFNEDEYIARRQAFEQEYGRNLYTPSPELARLQHEMNYNFERINRELQDLQKTLDTMQLMEKLQRPAEMSKWLKDLGLNNFEIISIMDKINKQRKDRKQ